MLPIRTSGFHRWFGLGPATIALLYAAFSTVWIWGTDRIVNRVADPQLRLFLATSKGVGFVAVTAFLLFLTIRKLVMQTKGAQQLLSASEAEYRGVVEAANEGVCRLTSEDRIGFVNPRMAALLDRNAADLLGRPLSDFLDDADQATFAEQLLRWRNGATEQHDFCFRAADAVEIRTIVSGTPVFDPHSLYTGSILMLMDITERQRAQEQLQQSQKLEAVGRFAGGIAHDFNNVLGIIVGYVTLLKDRFTEDSKGREQAEIVLQACERAASLVKQLIGFSRKQPLRLSVIDLNATVTNLGRMLPRVIGEDIRISVRAAATAATVRADPVQVEQVLINLAANARDAMPKGGELLIESGRVEGSSIFGIEDIPPGVYSYLQVTDSGVGMTADVRSRIFEPFFTTKEVGKGTGLGLSMVYGIVKQSGGFIGVVSVPQRGTTFSICFPFTDAEQQLAPPPELVHSGQRGSETILLVEDENDLRMVTRHILMQQGYRILEAKDGREALAICRAHLPVIDLVMTDLVMPHMGGRELAMRLVELKPALKIVFVSGYADDSSWTEHARENIATIEKPIRPEVLVRRIRQILDGGEIRATA